jgi:subtilisin-like proprotein convertase family protein
MSRKLMWLMLLLAFSSVAHAIPQAPVPTAASYQVLDVNSLATVVPTPLDLVRLGEEDAQRDAEGLPLRFAVPERVSITPFNNGTWEDLGKGQMLWRLRIIGREGTNSLNLGFTRFKMTANGRLLLYSTDGSQILPAFTAADNEEHGQLWTPVVVTDDLIVELTIPKREMNALQLRLGWINQGYRGFGTITPESYNKSGSCNMDVECLAGGDTWREEMRSVGVISTGGSTFCSGSLINDTANDRKMYFMTANHCTINSGNAASLVVYWNYQNSFCRTPGSAQSGQAGDGTLTQFHTGSFFRAANAPSDFTLVELDDPAVAAYNHFWAGWDRSAGDFTCTAGSPCAGIHHPSTDEKRITYVTTNTATTSYSGTTSPGDGTHVWAHWATDPPGPFTVPGVTEGGSSGSPLYNASGRFIGQLHGGPSSCGATGDNLSDYYGRFSVSWTGGGTNSTRLSNWLDAGNTGATTIAGIENTGGCTPPAPPTGVTATAVSQTQINVSWTASAGATSYNILRSTTNGGPYSLAGTSATTSFSDTGLTCNTAYYYVVQAVGSCASGNSSQATATTQACSGGGNQVLTFSASPATAIPDNNATGITSTINVSNSMTITSVSVNVGITHTYQGDLEVALIGPDNTTVLLHNLTGAGTDNINTTYNITTRSAQALTAFNGKNTSGAWKLRVRDLAAADTGTLNSWKVTFNGYYTLTANTAIPDNNATGITSTINVPATGNVVSLRVRVDINHTYQGDLEVALIGPDNTTVLLHNRTGGTTDNIKTVYADLTAPAQALSAFNGKAINGAWKLRVRDLAAADTGTLNFWEIDFRTN